MSESWQNQLDKFFQRWINLGVDGFILDDPDGYINAGTDNHDHCASLLALCEEASYRLSLAR